MTDKQIIIDKDKFEKAENEPINQEAVNKFIKETDKFYVNDVDVSKCGYFCCGKVCSWFNDDCKNYDICYYKQLKRKEQECEELKEARKNSRCAWKSLEGTFCPEAQEQLEAYKMEADEGKEINAELKAENEELKRQYKELGQCSKRLKDYFEKEKETLSNRFLRLKQTLTEIKEIAESEMDSKEFMTIQCMLNGSVDNKNKVLKQILQKINEVEDEG